MKRLLILALCMWGIARAQTPPANYTDLNARYQWLGGAFKSLTIPAYGDTTLITGQWRKAGAVLVDTTGSNKGVYVWYDNKWNVVGGGGVAVNLYTANGILEGNRLLTGKEGLYGMYFDSLGYFRVNRYAEDGNPMTLDMGYDNPASMKFTGVNGLGSEHGVVISTGTPGAAALQAGNTSFTALIDSLQFYVNGNVKAVVADSFRIRQNVRLDGAMKLKKGTASRWLGVQDENGRDAIQHSWNTAAKIYFQYLYDTAGAFHWNIFNEARTATWIVFGVKRYLTRVSDTAYFGLGNYPGDPSTYEPLQEGYMWMNDATANFRGYRNGLSRSFVMNNTGYGVDTVYLNGAGDSLVFEIFGRRYAFLKGSGGGGGTPGGSNTQVQYNSGGSFAGSSAFTYNSGVATLGASGTLGGIDLVGSTSGTVSIRPKTTAGTWTASWPNTAGTARQFIQTDGTGALSFAHGIISDLGAAGAANTIDNTNFAQNWQWSTLGAGNGLNLTSTSTAAASNTQTLFNVALSGANGTSTQTTWAGKIANTHTGTSSTNYGLEVTASGATNNYGLKVTPSVIIGSPTLSANHGIVIQNPTNTSSDGIRIYANNLTSFADYGWGKITRAGGFEFNTTSGGLLFTGSVGARFGSTSTPSAKIHIDAGGTAAGSAPLKFTSGSLMTTPEAGAVEFLTDKAYLTISTGTARKELTLNDAALTSGTVPVATTNGRLTDGLIISDGSITPTSTDANVASKTWKQLHYTRVGNRVNFSGTVLVAATAAGAVTMTLNSTAIATSNFTLADDVAGTGTDGDNSNTGVYLDANTSATTFVLHFTAVNTGSHPVYFSGSYRIK